MQNQIQPSDTIYQVNLSELTARTPASTDLVMVQQTGDNDIRKSTIADIGSVITSGLATVATSGSYNDLTDQPTIPSGLPDDGTLTDNTSGTGNLAWVLGATNTAAIKKVSSLASAVNWSTMTVNCTSAAKNSSHSVLLVNNTASSKTITVSVSGATDYVVTGDTNSTFELAANGYVELNVLAYDNYPSLIIKTY